MPITLYRSTLQKNTRTKYLARNILHLLLLGKHQLYHQILVLHLNANVLVTFQNVLVGWSRFDTDKTRTVLVYFQKALQIAIGQTTTIDAVLNKVFHRSGFLSTVGSSSQDFWANFADFSAKNCKISLNIGKIWLNSSSQKIPGLMSYAYTIVIILFLLENSVPKSQASVIISTTRSKISNFHPSSSSHL